MRSLCACLALGAGVGVSAQPPSGPLPEFGVGRGNNHNKGVKLTSDHVAHNMVRSLHCGLDCIRHSDAL